MDSLEHTPRDTRRRALVPGRLGLQAAVLVGIGLAFVGEPALVAAPPPGCQPETMCTFKKPLLVYALEYSTAMNAPFDPDQTRWEAAVASLTTILDANNGFNTRNYIQGVVRYGHDPDPGAPGTTIVGDTSGLVDGVKLDVPLYDADSPGKPYLQCDQADAIKAALAAVPPPLDGAPDGIGAWTRGGLAAALAHVQQALADHPEDTLPPTPRPAFMVALTQGVWTSRDGGQTLQPPADDPAPLAADAFLVANIPTFVVSLGDDLGKQRADELASAGGSGLSGDADAMVESLDGIIDEIVNKIDPPLCAVGRPRLMVLLDASSGMLNRDNGSERAPPGEGGWDLARAALLGPDPVFAAQGVFGLPMVDMMSIGMTVFGDDTPAEEKLLVQYGACTTAERLPWALDPATSCAPPGCLDPYALPPVPWTFKDGALVDPPGFDDTTLSHMPRCDLDPQQPDACSGSGSALHRGLALVADNLAAYKSECKLFGDDPCDSFTPYLNLLVTEGLYDSPDADVQASLQAMHAAGVQTLVLGLGDRADTPQAQDNLAKLADWGSGGQHGPFTLDSQDQLEAALLTVLDGQNFDPCCLFPDCSDLPGPTETTGEADATTDAPADTTDPGTADASGLLGDTSAGTNETNPDVDTDDTDAPPATATGPDVPTSDGPPADPSGAGDQTGSSSSGTLDADAVDRGCACAAGPRGAGWWWQLALVGALRRRRRRPASAAAPRS